MLKNIKTTKNIIIGIAIGISITSIPTFANTVKQFVLTKVSYPIIVNGEEYVNNELPVLNYEGSTYVPLKAVGDVLGSNVKWNSDLGRVEIGDGSNTVPELSQKSTVEHSQTTHGYIDMFDIIHKHNVYFEFDKDKNLMLFKTSQDFYEGKNPVLTNISYKKIYNLLHIKEYDYLNVIIPALK